MSVVADVFILFTRFSEVLFVLCGFISCENVSKHCVCYSLCWIHDIYLVLVLLVTWKLYREFLFYFSCRILKTNIRDTSQCMGLLTCTGTFFPFVMRWVKRFYTFINIQKVTFGRTHILHGEVTWIKYSETNSSSILYDVLYITGWVVKFFVGFVCLSDHSWCSNNILL